MDLYTILNSNLSHAKSLYELKLLKINFSLNYPQSKAPPSNIDSVKQLKLDYSGQNVDGFDSEGWCEKLAQIFPQLEVLIAKQPYDDGTFAREIEENKEKFYFLKGARVIRTEQEKVH